MPAGSFDRAPGAHQRPHPRAPIPATVIAHGLAAITAIATAALIVTGLVAAVSASPARADELPQIHALTGVRIIVAPGQEIASGTIVIRDGVIEAVGENVTVPPEARIWELEGDAPTVYAGLIEPYAPRSWPASDNGGDKKDGANGNANDDAPDGGHHNAMVTPERDMTFHAVDDGTFKKLRVGGFTSAVFVPADGIFRGRSVLLNLGDGGLERNLLLRDVAQNVTLRTHPGGKYPNSLMGAVALVRQTFYDARWYASAQAAYEARPAQGRPPFNTALAELVEAAGGRATVAFETDDVLGTLRVDSLVRELELDALLLGHGEEYKRLDAVVATGLPLLLPVDFPDPPDVGDLGDADGAPPALDVGLEKLRHWDLAPENPARLVAAGVRPAFTSLELGEPKEIHAKLATAIERGLSPDDALAGLTTRPAEILGVADRLGTVEAGKIANLVVTDGDLFAEKPKIREVWIDGRRYELADIKPPEVDPAGTWEITLNAGEFEMEMTLELSGPVDGLSGTLTGPFGALPLSSIEVSGKTVLFDSDSPMGTFNFEMKIDGDRADGSGASPRGSFTFKGKRTAGPSGEVSR